MEPKLLLLFLILTVACLVAPSRSFAAIGYVNVSFCRGFSLVANPLDVTPANHVSAILLNPPDGAVYYRFDSASQTYGQAVTYLAGIGWRAFSGNPSDPALTLKPGEAFWVESPAEWTATIVGEIKMGSLTNPLPVDYSLKL